MKAIYFLLAFLYLFSLLPGCVTIDPPGSQAKLFSEKLNRYPQSGDTLMIPQLTGNALNAVSKPAPGEDIVIIVHPAYSLFFRDENRTKYTEAKYALLAKQFEDEALFIADAARAEKIMILVIPRNYLTESIAPLSYTTYLNATTAAGRHIFYVFSQSPSNGSISMNDMVDLYRFIQGIGPAKVLVGGGYIGRCQREFYNELIMYIEKPSSFIVPEISTISPDDISDSEARTILESIQRQDYTPVKNFIDKKLESANILSLPQKKEF